MSPSNWNTSTQGVFNYTSPIEYQTPTQLSSQYYQNLKPGTIGYKYDKNGLKYSITGISK